MNVVLLLKIFFSLYFAHGFVSDAVLLLLLKDPLLYLHSCLTSSSQIPKQMLSQNEYMCKCSFKLCTEMQFFSSILSFGLITWAKLSKGQLVWCQFGRPLSDLLIHTHPDVLLLVRPMFGFQPAILSSSEKNFPEIPGLQELFNFFKITLFLNVSHRTLFIIF